ncbi:MAG TPA: carboxypeptidase-like regulatory domain-containing protein [Gemmataceae bacterium]|jgi:hypothetical protein|nr:carboxypeptidase-like regulatory domain-containing protein [Gemmataceae bacterium]
MRLRVLFCCALLLALGCNSKGKYVSVSGRVTLDGKPLVNALVTFQPIAAKDEALAAGAGSSGKTNENGEFTLMAANGQNGAVVGKHRVTISVIETQIGSSDERPLRGGWPQAEKVPTKYNADSKETFDVLAGGTSSANFDLTSK